MHISHNCHMRSFASRHPMCPPQRDICGCTHLAQTRAAKAQEARMIADGQIPVLRMWLMSFIHAAAAEFIGA